MFGGELELHDGDTSFLQMGEEPNFGRLQEHQTAADLASSTTSGTSDTVNVVSGLLWLSLVLT